MGAYIGRSILMFLCCTGVIFAAQTQVAKKIEPLIKGYYPTYPQTTTPRDEIEAKQIARGEYLAKMGDCIACHTDVEHKAPSFAGGLSIATPFGTFYSPNITPDKDTGIGTWSLKDFTRVLKEGKDPHGSNYFPVFPYVYFSNMTDNDIQDLYVYFMHIPAVNLKNKKLPFPFNLPGARASLIGWKLLFFYPNTTLKYEPEESAQWNRGKYIVDGLGHCSMCHTPLNVLGSPKQKYYLTGGFVDGYWAPNITRYGLDKASTYEVADVFVKGKLLNNAGPVAGPMAEVNHNSLSHLTQEDRLAIATYLSTVISEEPLGLPASQDKPTLRRGRQVYLHACIICHQKGEMSAPLIGDGANWFERLQNSGLTGLYRHVIYGYNSMPIKGACITCSDNDLVSAVDYLLERSLSRSQWLDLQKTKAKKYPAKAKTIYEENCASCHKDGKFGAPITGDKALWASIIAKNMDVLIENTLNGQYHTRYGNCNKCSTSEIIDALKYMVSQSKTEGNFSLW